MEAIAVGAFTFLFVVTQVSQTRIAQLIGTKFAKHAVSRVRRAVAAQIAPLIGTISATVNGVLGAGQGGQGEPMPPARFINQHSKCCKASKLDNLMKSAK
ncbi:hypothetical protein ACFX1X_031085 [Malus domestica]